MQKQPNNQAFTTEIQTLLPDLTRFARVPAHCAAAARR